MALSVFYGFDLMAAPASSVLAYELHRPAIEARRRFEAKQASGVNPSPDEVLELIRLETGDEDEAQRVASEYMAALLRQDAG